MFGSKESTYVSHDSMIHMNDFKGGKIYVQTPRWTTPRQSCSPNQSYPSSIIIPRLFKFPVCSIRNGCNHLSLGRANAFKRPRLIIPLPLVLLLGVFVGNLFLEGVVVIVSAILTRFGGDWTMFGSKFS